MDDTAWTEHAIFWHVDPLGSTGAEPEALAEGEPVRHRLVQLEAWLDYAIELGCSGLLLGPIFASESHGCDTVDHFRIDPRLGDEADFDHLVAAARSRGMRVVLNGVFNHVGRSFPRFAAAQNGGPESSWFRRAGTDWDVFEGHRHLVTLNHDSDEVARYVADVMRFWGERGADGWRLDAAYAVPAAFWRRVVPAVRETFPAMWFFGEVIHGDYAGYVRDSGLDPVTDYELWKAIWSSLNDQNPHELAWALGRHDEVARTFTPVTFVGNHDVTRLASRLDDDRHLGHALVVLLTVSGVPCLYYGDEQGLRGVKEDRAGGDDAVRPPFPAGPEEVAECGRPIYRLHQRLIGLRRRHPWLVRAAYRSIHNEYQAMACAVSGSETQELVVLLNVSDHAVQFPLAEASAYDVLDCHDRAELTEAIERVAPHGWTVLERR